MTSGRKSLGIVEVTKGPVDLRVPPNTPPDMKLVYGMAVPFQVAEGKAALAVSIREDLVKGVDFENGADVVLFDDLSSVNSEGAVQVTRNHEEPNPNSGPPGQPGIMVKYPLRVGFVPLGAKRADGSPHPHAGTGFGIDLAIAWRTEHEGPPPYGVNYWGSDPRALVFSVGPEGYEYLELHQFAYDGRSFRVLKTERLALTELLPGWTISNMGFSSGIPDGDDILLPLVGGRSGDAQGSGVGRWRRQGEDWRPVSYVPVTSDDGSFEPTLVRDMDGSLLFSARGNLGPGNEQAAESTTPQFDIRVWRSDARGDNWAKVVHVRGCVSTAPVTLNQAADGTPYIIASLYQVFLHPTGIIKVRRDPEGRLWGGGWTREILAIWSMTEDRSGLQTPFVVRDCRAEFGPTPGGTTWRVDHAVATTVQLADGRQHNVLGQRLLEYGEMTHAMPPTPVTGCYLEEVVSAGEPRAIWRF